MMQGLLRFASAIDRVNDWIGRAVAWLTLLMVGVAAYNAVVRYLGRWLGANLSRNAYIEMQWYVFSLLFLLGAAYTLRHQAHVRVDVFYARLSEKGRAWVNLAGGVLFLLPFCGVLLWLSWPSVRNSWAVLEVSPDPGGLPRYPIKTAMMLAFAMLGLQGVSNIIQNVAILRGVEHEHAEPDAHEGL